MREIRELRRPADAFLIEPRIGIGRRLVRLVRAPLASKIGARIARVVRRPTTVLALGPKTFVTRPRLQQCAVDREVLVRQQAMRVGFATDRLKEGLRDCALDQAVSVFRECRMIPDRVHPCRGPRTTETTGCSPVARSANARSGHCRGPAAATRATTARVESRDARCPSTPSSNRGRSCANAASVI